MDHEAGIALLPELTVYIATQIQIVRIGNLVGGNNPGADGSMRIERLAHREGGRMELPVARGDVVRHEISEYVRLGLVGRDTLSGVTDDDTELDLVIELLGHPGIDRIE